MTGNPFQIITCERLDIMGLSKYANRRDANEPEIFEMFRALGCSVCSMDLPADALVGYRGRSYLVEVKTPKGKLTASQEAFLSNWLGDHHIVRTIEDVQELVKGWDK